MKYFAIKKLWKYLINKIVKYVATQYNKLQEFYIVNFYLFQNIYTYYCQKWPFMWFAI